MAKAAILEATAESPDDLGAALKALATDGGGASELRKRALPLVKRAFAAARGAIRARFEGGAITGVEAAHALSDLQDDIIATLFDFATAHVYVTPNPTEAEHLAVVATGGYGRGMLAPHSDIDLLFLRPYRQTAWGESVIEFILHTLWDLGLKVGHATRSVIDCVRQAKADITIRTALLEARYIAGEQKLAAELKKRFWSDVAAGTGRDFVEAKLAERATRHKRQGESRYLIEPNIKEGKGGLRDLQTLYWIGKYLYRAEEPRDLIQHGVFTAGEFETFEKAEALFWQVRCHLHYLTNRAEDRLSFDVQPEMAHRLGHDDPQQKHAVEAFMRTYFLAAKDVGDLTRIFCAALEEQNKKSRPLLASLMPGFLKPRSGTEDFFVENGRLRAREGLFEADPANLIRLFHVADAKRVDVHPETLRTVTRSLDLIDDKLRNDREVGSLFLDILSSHNDPERALRLMNESGVLGRFVPEFGRVVALMQFNMYHHYTVDEHLIRAVGNMAAIERGTFKAEHPLSSEIIKRVGSRPALYLAMLLHDIAKGLHGDHSEVGASIARAIAMRLGLSPPEIADVVWLVERHLTMSDMAQRRDISDPKTVQDFVRAVQTPERLRLLLLLTVADIRAVGPGVWNGWKGQLLRDLYYEADAQISGGEVTHGARVAGAKAALEQRLPDWPGNLRERALARHTDSYWLTFDAADHDRHARMARKADDANELLALDAKTDEFQSITEIVIQAADHPGLFSRLAGAISVSGGSIVDAKIFTTTDGYALDVFRVQDAEGGPFGDADRIERLRQTIMNTLHGKILPKSVFAKRRPRRRVGAFDVSPRVHLDNEASNAATVVEVEAQDRPGLLFDVTNALFRAGLSISSAVIATYGERAVDVFYVRDGYGHKLTHPARRAAVEEKILAALNAR